MKAIITFKKEIGMPKTAIPANPRPQCGGSITDLKVDSTNATIKNKLIERSNSPKKHNKVNCQNFKFVQPDKTLTPYLN